MGAVFPGVVEHFSWSYAWYIPGVLALAMAAPNASPYTATRRTVA
jgi:hypothetical protein